MAGASMRKLEAYHLFVALIDLLEELKGTVQYNADEIQSDRSQLEYPESNRTISLRASDGSSDAQKKLFEKTLITALALMTVADGSVDEDEVRIVIEFIKEEESISDKAEALSKLKNR